MRKPLDSPNFTANFNFDVLKDYHPLLSIEYTYLQKENLDLENYNDSISFPWLSNKRWTEIEKSIDLLCLNTFEKTDWKNHKNNLLYLVTFFVFHEAQNYDFRHDRENQLKMLARNVFSLNEQLESNYLPEKIKIGNTTLSGELLIREIINGVIKQLNKTYETNALEKMPPTLIDKNAVVIKALKSTFNKNYNRTDSVRGKYLGYLAYTINAYLENETNLKSDNKPKLKKNKINDSLTLSNNQGAFIYELLVGLRLMDISNTPPHLTIRKFITAFHNSFIT